MAVTKTTTQDGFYTVDTFTGSGTISWSVPATITTADMYVVAGGGGAGNAYCQYYGSSTWYGYKGTTNESLNVAVTGSYTVTVGSGGANGDHWWNSVWGHATSTGTVGGTSSVGSLLTASGGASAGFTDYNNAAGVYDTKWGKSLSNVGGGGYRSPCSAVGEITPVNGIVIIRYLYPAALVTTQNATSVADTTATGNGNITTITVGTVSRRGFCYKVGITGDPTTSDSTAYDDGTFTIGAFTKAITGLSSGIAYRIRSYAVTAYATSYGGTVQVITITLGEIDFMEYSSNALAQVAYVSSGSSSTALSGVVDGVVTGFQFRKEIPNTESHVLVQTKNRTIQKSNNTTNIPSQDTFSQFVVLPTDNLVNYTEAPDQSMVMCDGKTNYVYSGLEYRVAKFINYDAATTSLFSYDYTDIVNNNLTDSNNIAKLYASADSPYGYSIYIGSTRPITGAKFYMSVANASASTVAVSYWNGSAFAAVTTLVDGTNTSSATLTKTGVISFDQTLGLCKVKAINENVAYWYNFVFTGIDTSTAISQVSLVSPIQKLVDIWDGTPRQIYACLKDTTDYTMNVYKLDYYASDTTTYAPIGGMTSSVFLYAGFNERLLGMKFYLGETYVNANTATLTIYYWNGSAWADVGTLDDGTLVGGKTLNRSGVVTWNAPSSTLEYTTSVGNSAKWYYYKIKVSATITADVRLDNITGIPAQVSIPPYRYPVLWQNRLWLLNDQSKNKNVGIGSSYGTVCVFNGADSPSLTFGGTQEVMCAAPLFTRYGGSIYENLVVCKRNQTYLVDGTSPSTYVVYKIANSVGCIAPQTMKVCDTGYEVAPGLAKHVVVWLSSAGVVMFDANSVINISSDISDRFDSNSDTYINTSIVEKFTGFYDAKRTTYHIQIATGTSTTLNEEWCYDLTRRKWYQINRGTKYLTCGFEVEDDLGNKFCYGGTDDGYIERLEYGNTFDGVPITYILRLPDDLLDGTLMYVKEVRRVKLIGKTNSTIYKVIVRHYGDGNETASTPAITTINQNAVGKAIFQAGRSTSFRGVFHSFEFEITTTDSDSGFNPLYVAGLYKTIREDLQDGDN